MKLLDIITAPWAIEPAKLLEIQAIYATHLRGEKIDIPAVEARLGRPLDNTQQKGYAIQDGVAILSLRARAVYRHGAESRSTRPRQGLWFTQERTRTCKSTAYGFASTAT